jgi:hypothetical protein
MRFRDLVTEDGALASVTTADIANVRTSLTKKPIKRKRKISEGTHEKYSQEDVASKVAGAEKNTDLKRNSVVYGIEDEDGNMTKVYIAKEQEDDFKQALEQLQHDENIKDVSEILYNLRNKFNIMHVEWPKLPEDEEVDNKLAKPEGGEDKEGVEDDVLNPKPEDMPGAEGVDSLPPEPAPAPTDDNASILLKIIDMLKADADAKKAESHAEAKKAEMEQAKLTIQLTNTKVKNEEDMLRAEEHFKKQAEQKKEEERLAKLAKYRNDVVNSSTYENHMKFTDIMGAEVINEDTAQQVSAIQTRIADITNRKAKAVKIYDDQLRMMQNQLASLTKRAESENRRIQPNSTQQF